MPTRSRRALVYIATIAGCLGVFIIDRFIAIDVAVGDLYTPIILLALLTGSRPFVHTMIVVSTVLTLIDLVLAVGHTRSLAIELDHVSAMVAVVVTAGLGLRLLGAMSLLQQGVERERLLLNELEHRVRNNLASLMAIVDLAGEPQGESSRELTSAIKSRIQGITSVHRLLFHGRWSGADLRELIGTISLSRAEAIRTSGPPVRIPARQLTPVGMVINELILNSEKYGALRSPAGRVDVSWTLLDQNGRGQRLELAWVESGGPAIQGTPAPGLGTELIRGFVQHELHGEVELRYPPSGAAHRFSIALEAIPAEAARAAAAAPAA